MNDTILNFKKEKIIEILFSINIIVFFSSKKMERFEIYLVR